jgi:hypothetical protein
MSPFTPARHLLRGVETSELDEPDEGPAGEAVRSLGHSNDHRPDLA